MSRRRILLLLTFLFGGALIAMPVRSQVPGPATPVAVPFPTTAPGQIGTTVPPLNIFYVSPQGADCEVPTVNTACPPTLPPNLACSASSPCLTIQFALAHAHDGDAIALAGGDYHTINPILVSKLVTIAPNSFSFAGGTTTSTTQAAFSLTLTCASVVPPFSPVISSATC